MSDDEIKKLLRSEVFVIGLQVWRLQPTTAGHWAQSTRRRMSWDHDEVLDFAAAARLVRSADHVLVAAETGDSL